MEKTTLVTAGKREFVTITVDTTVPCVIDVWDGPFGSQENFRNGLLKVVEILEKHELKKWLADLRGMVGSFDSSREWLATELMPKAAKKGLLYEAIVLPKDIFSKLSTKDTILKIGGIEIRQFDDYEKAINWLSSIK